MLILLPLLVGLVQSADLIRELSFLGKTVMKYTLFALFLLSSFFGSLPPRD
jgi:hypothetical protein